MMKRRDDKDSALVYSTDLGRLCPQCNRQTSVCNCKEQQKQADAAAKRKAGGPAIRKERKGRNGKDVTVISGLPISDAELQTLGKELKQKCGAGGTVKDGAIEIQGDRVAQLAEELRKRGYAVKG